MRNGFTLAAEINECEREESTDGTIEFIGRRIQFGE
jgi:hypothetical protein